MTQFSDDCLIVQENENERKGALLKNKSLKKVISVLITVFMFLGMVNVCALDLEFLIAEENFDDKRELTAKTEGNASAEIIADESGNNMLQYTTSAGNSSWSTCVSFSVTAGNTDAVGKVKMRMKLADSMTSNSVMFGVLNNPIRVTKEWQDFEVNVSGGYTIFNIQCPGAGITAYVDDIEMYTVIKNVQPPQVSSSVPEDGGECTPSDFVTVTFNNRMSDSALDYLNYTLSGGEQTVADVQKTGDKTYKICFSGMLDEFSDYTLEITGLFDTYDQQMADAIISFSTGEYQKPSVISVSPENNSFGLASGEEIVVTFDQTVFADEAEVSLSGNGSCELLENGNNINIILEDLTPNTAYSLILSGVKNETGKFADDFEYSFITSAEKNVVYENSFSNSDDAQSIRIATENSSVSYSMSGGIDDSSCLVVNPMEYGQIALRKNGAPLVPEVGKVYKYSFKVKADASQRVWLMDGRYNNNPYTDISVGTDWKTLSYVFSENEEVVLPYIQFLSETKSYIDDIEVVELKAAELVNTSDLFDEDIAYLDKKVLTFVFNKALDEASLNSSAVKLNGSSVAISEKGENWFSVDISNVAEDGEDYAIEIKIRDVDGMNVSLKREFSLLMSVRGNMKIEKENGKFVLKVENLENTSDTEQNATAFLIVYKDGQMIDGVFIDITLDPFEQLPDTIELEIDAAQGQAQGFLWDGMATRRAFLPAVSSK